MALSYNLKYRKQNFSYKVLLEKEGEIVIDRQCFRLKGKGAQDHGEIVYFSDIKELIIQGEELKFMTFHKDRFVLSGFINLFDSFLKDFFRVRNEYLAEVLFMKVGMLYQEYEGQVEVTNAFGKTFPKGKARIQFYEGSILILPEKNDCFALFLNFLKSHDFDEDEYLLKLSTDNGSVVSISKLGTSFEDVEETLESLLGKMYERAVNHLKEVLPDFDAGTLLKLASLMRHGKCVPISILKKIHDDLPKKLETLILPSSEGPFLEKIQWLRKQTEDQYFYGGISFSIKGDNRALQVKPWILLAFPQYNLVGIAMTSYLQDPSVYFFRITMETGIVDRQEKLAEKIVEINQAMYLLHYEMSPFYKDKRELRKTRYRIALKKLTCLRSLRKSYIGKSTASDIPLLKEELEKFKQQAEVVNKNYSFFKK